jgi:hypothetical protein
MSWTLMRFKGELFEGKYDPLGTGYIHIKQLVSVKPIVRIEYILHNGEYVWAYPVSKAFARREKLPDMTPTHFVLPFSAPLDNKTVFNIMMNPKEKPNGARYSCLYEGELENVF